MSKARYVFGSQENYFSLFSIDAINHKTLLLYDRVDYKKISFFKTMFLNINKIKRNKKLTTSPKDLLYLKKINRVYDEYFENL